MARPSPAPVPKQDKQEPQPIDTQNLLVELANAYKMAAMRGETVLQLIAVRDNLQKALEESRHEMAGLKAQLHVLTQAMESRIPQPSSPPSHSMPIIEEEKEEKEKK